MSIRRRMTGLTAGLIVAGTAFAAPLAGAATQTESYPETPALNPDLPIIHTTHGSDHKKANVLNPRPVCNPWEDHRTVVYKVSDRFLPAGTISTTNQTKKDIPLQQDLSKSQSISLSVNGDRTETTSMNLGGKGSGKKGEGSFGISHEIATKIGASASYSLSWEAGQSIGPYDVPPNHTGEATYGFRVLNMTGTQQYCKPNGTWSTPTAWNAMQPVKNEVRVKLYDKLSDSYAPNKDAQNTTDVNDPKVVEEDKNLEADAEVIKDSEGNAKEATEKVSEAEGKNEEAADKKKQEEVDAKEDKKDSKHKLDLEPYMTVVKTSGLTSQQLVDTIQKSGLDFDHASAVGLTTNDLQHFIDSTSKAYSGSNEYNLDLNAAMKNYKISNYTKAKRFHTASFMGRSSMGWAVSIEYDNYSIVMLLSATPEAIQESGDLKGFVDLYNSIQSDCYVR